MSTKVFGYKPGSRSAKALAVALGGAVLRHQGSAYRYRPTDIIVNWGSGQNTPLLRNAINNPAAVNRASNKLTAFTAMREGGVNVPEFWTRQQDIPADAYPIVCRTVLNGHSGAGIVIADRPDQLVNAPLYVKYVKKLDEYRIHVVKNRRSGETRVISQQRKAIRNGHESNRVRNLANGYVFVRDGVNPPASVLEQAQLAIRALNLDFGAVDVIYNRHLNSAFVLEVNTAPGLEGTTIQDYANGLRQIF